MINVIIPRFLNTECFSPAAQLYMDNGSYTNAHPGTKSYYDFWDQELNRIRTGYSVGSVRITGYHYYYLNYSPILRAKQGSSGSVAQEVVGFPDFWDYDYIFFNNVDYATSIGKHMAVLKARRKGYSYKVGSMLARNFSTVPNSRCYAMAYQEEYLLKDGLLTKAYDIVNFVDTNTPFQQPRLIDQRMHKMSGFKENINGTDVVRGFKSEIMGISMKDDPDKARGKAGILGIYEEGGRFPNLTRAWEINTPSYRKGTMTTGLQIVFGTGGADDVDFEGLERMFYDPDTYNILAFNNIWDEGALGSKCAFFVPAYINYEGCIDRFGNSDIQAAKDFQEKERIIKKNAKDLEAYGQYTREFPWTPQEALSVDGNNVLPTAELQEQLNIVSAKRLHDSQLVIGHMVHDGTKVKFQMDPGAGPIWKFPHAAKSDLTGCIWILEAPVRDHLGNVDPGQYLAIHDPYAIDNAKDTGPKLSLGVTYIIKIPSVSSPMLNGCIVAAYTGRPHLVDDYNRQLFMLLEYYNAKLGFESNRGKVVDYAKLHKKLHYLMEEPDIQKSKLRRKSFNTLSYGLTMNADLKLRGQHYLRDWLLTPVKTNEDGSQKLRLHYIYDPALLQELIKYHEKGNFDRVSALLVGMFYIEEEKLNSGYRPTLEYREKIDKFFLHTQHFV